MVTTSSTSKTTGKIKTYVIIFIAGMLVMLLIFMISRYVMKETGVNLCTVCGILSP